jgi:hypothetical protein
MTQISQSVDSAEEITKHLRNQSNQRRIAEAMKRLDEMLRHANQFAESHK